MAKTGLPLGQTSPLCFHSPGHVSLPLTAHSFSRNPVSSPGQFSLSFDGSYNPSCLRKKGRGLEDYTEGVWGQSTSPAHLGQAFYLIPLLSSNRHRN